MAEQPTVIVVPTTAGGYAPQPEAKAKAGLSTGTKLILLFILLGILGVVAYMIISGYIAPAKDCTGLRRPFYQVCIGPDEKVLGSKNCCRCRTLIGGIGGIGGIMGYSDMYECGH